MKEFSLEAIKATSLAISSTDANLLPKGVQSLILLSSSLALK